ncbi:MAG TPA: DUF6569 family protein [Gemmataceae bacterium]|jgi:hypothetical protein
MSTRGRTLAGMGLLAWAVGLSWAEPAPPAAPAPPKAGAPAVKSVSGPFTHGNLTVFLLHGPDVLAGKDILTLQDALAQKKAVVHETSNVNNLSVENTSEDAIVFIQSGDIVKGGKQDRAIAFDLLLPPKSGLVSIGSFCCESGRWTKRGQEAADYFAESNAQIAGKDLKAAVVGNDASKQGEVWQKVGETQQKLSRNVGKPVADPASPKSLQLTLENKQLQEKVTAYETALAGCVADRKDVIGVALVVNGKVEGAEVYGSAALFGKLWPKTLKAAATDALAQLDEKKPFDPAPAKAVEAFLADAAAGPAKEVPMPSTVVRAGAGRGAQTANAAAEGRQVAANAAGPAAPAAQPPARVRIVRYDGSKVLLVESQDKEKSAVIHRCYIAKDPPKEEPKKP